MEVETGNSISTFFDLLLSQPQPLLSLSLSLSKTNTQNRKAPVAAGPSRGAAAAKAAVVSLSQAPPASPLAPSAAGNNSPAPSSHARPQSAGPENAADASNAEAGSKAPPKKKKAIEDIYKKKTQLEHILLRPDTYVGSTERQQVRREGEKGFSFLSFFPLSFFSFFF